MGAEDSEIADNGGTGHLASRQSWCTKQYVWKNS